MLAETLSTAGAWLARKPSRLTVLNALLLAGVLAMIGSTELFRFVGGVAVVLCGLAFAGRTARRSMRVGARNHPYDLVVLWAPGAIAIALAAAALMLMAAYPAGSFPHLVGLGLFVIEFAMLALATGESGARDLPAGAA